MWYHMYVLNNNVPASVRDSWHFGKDPDEDPWSLDPYLWPADREADADPTLFVFDLQDTNNNNSRTVEIKVYLNFLVCWWKDPDQLWNPMRIQEAQKHTYPADPDPEY